MGHFPDAPIMPGVLIVEACAQLCSVTIESDGTDETSLKYEEKIDGMKCHTAETLEEALRAAGFSKVRCGHHEEKPWIVVVAKK